MTELTHAMRAISASLKDRAQVGRGAGSKENAQLLDALGGAFADAADSLDHRWREANERLTAGACSCPNSAKRQFSPACPVHGDSA